jgi:hypothetical protein
MSARQSLSVEEASKLLCEASWLNTMAGDAHEGRYVVWASLNDVVALTTLDGSLGLLPRAKSIWSEHHPRGHDLAVLDERNRLFRYYVRK